MSVFRLELWFNLNGHELFAFRMLKRNGSGMKVKAVGLFSIEIISNNWKVKSRRVSRMYTQLVRAACDRMKLNSCFSIFSGKYLVLRFGRFTMLVANQLTRSVIDVRSQRQVNRSSILFSQAIK